MRVSGVNIFAYNNIRQNTQRSSSAAIQSVCVPMTEKDRFEKSPSFTAISTHGEFRFLTKDHIIHCIYCRKPMIYTGIVQDMLKSGVFSGPVAEFVEAAAPFRKYLKKGQHSVFQQIQKYAEKSPQTHLSEIISDLYHNNSLKKLVASQAKVFQSLVMEAEQLPAEVQTSFRAFMKVQHKRLYEIPYLEQFNPETFAYKVKKMSASIPDENLKTYLQQITLPLSEPLFNNPIAQVPFDIAIRIADGEKRLHLKTAEDYVRYIIKRVQIIGERLNRQDMVRLSKTSEKMLDGKPVVIPFSNKEFMQQLVLGELKDIRKTDLYYSMISIAQQLPSSRSSMNSFVVKHKYSNSDTIGYKLFEPSTTTLEHIRPLSEGGGNDLVNCALACKADNNERQSTPLYLYLQKWDTHNPQIYFNDIINIANSEHLIKPSDIDGMAQTVLKQGKIIIDTSKLKK